MSRRPSRKRVVRKATREGSVPDGMRKLWALLTPAERRTFLRVAAGMTLLGLLDMSSVASVMPFLALAGNPELLEGHPLFRQVGGWIGVTDVTTMLILLGSLVVVVIVTRSAFSAFIHWRAMKFAWSSNHRLARSQLDRYLHRPYIYFVEHNTSGAKVNILSEINTITNNVMMPSMEMITGTVSVVSVVTVLVFVDWKLALLTIGILGGSYGMAYVAVKGRLKRLGRRSVAANRERFQSVSEAFGGIKEVIALGRRDEFVQRFSVPSWRLAQYRVAHRIISQMPKYILETIAFSGIVLIVIYLLADRAELGAALAVVGLYAVAGLRLLPALQAVFGSGAAIRYNLAAVDFVHDDFFGEEEYPPVPRREESPVAMRVEDGLRLVEVSYRYPGSDIQAVQDIDIEVPSRHTVALVGHTGAGKTTIVDLILGLLRPQSGRLEVDGVALDEENLAAWQSAIGYVPQFIYLSDDTITRNIAFGLPDSEISEEAVHRAARLAHLHEFIESLPEGYSTVVGERGIRLSGGQRQRIGIARALYHDPQVLLFDEATSSLDGITEEEVMKDIRGLADRKTIILVAHRLSTVRHAHAIHLLDGGRIVAHGTYDELQRESAVFRRMSAGTSAVPADPAS